MKQTIKSSLFLTAILLFPLLAMAQNTLLGTYDENKKFVDRNDHMNICWIQPDGTVFIDWSNSNVGDSIVAFQSDNATYTAPATVRDGSGKKYTVSGVATKAFGAFYRSEYYGTKTRVTKIVLPESYKTIDNFNSVSYQYLIEFDGPGVETLGNYVFNMCQNLETVNMPKLKYVSMLSFGYCKKLKEVNFPELENILDNGNQCFSTCRALTKIDFPKLKKLGSQFFMSCENLKELNLPSVTDYSNEGEIMRSYGGGILNGCTNLETVNLQSLKHIGLFFNTTNFTKLTSVNLSNAVDAQPTGLCGLTAVDSLSLPSFETFVNSSGVEQDGPGTNSSGYWLRTPNSLKRLSIPKYRKTIDEPFMGFINNNNGAQAYDRCDLTYLNAPSATAFKCQVTADDLDTLILTSATTFLNAGGSMKGLEYLDISSLEKFGDWGTNGVQAVLKNASDIKHIICHDADILNQINALSANTYIGLNLDSYKKAANSYAAFNTVELTAQTSEIGDSLFYLTPNIQHLVLHKGCTTYSGKALSMLENLEDITVDDDNENYASTDGVLYDKAGSKLLYYPQANEGSTDGNGNTRQWTLDQSNGLKLAGIGPAAFYHFKNVRQIALGSNLSAIEADAFNGSHINRITFTPDAPLTSVGDFAFANMTEEYFRYLKMPAALQTIGKGAFSGDTQLQALELYDTNLTTVGDSAFAGETAITSIALPNSVTTIGKQAFQGNTAMEYFTVPRQCTAIGEGAFSGVSLKQLNIQVPSEALGNSLATAFTAKPTTVMLPQGKELSGGISAWEAIDTQSTDELQPTKYYTLTRSYPVDLSASADKAEFFRIITYNIDKTSNEGILYIEKLNDAALAAVPANTPVVALLKGDTPTTLSYSMSENEPEAWKSLLKGSPAAIRMDQMDDSDGTPNYNYLLSQTSADDAGVFNIVGIHYWSEESTRKGELTYLHIPYSADTGSAYARRFVFSTSRTTGIDSVAENIDSNNAWYNLQGQRVSKPAHGVFIHNGHKVIVR